MTRSYMTMLHPTDSQKEQLQLHFTAKHYLYNLYLKSQFGLYYAYLRNYSDYSKRKKLSREIKARYFLSGYSFRKLWVSYIREYEQDWLKSIFNKTVYQSFYDAEKAFNDYFKKLRGKPRFQGRLSKRSAYFYAGFKLERHRVKLPKLGWIQLSEFGYLPDQVHISNCWVSEDCGNYYISVQTKEDSLLIKPKFYSNGIGLDLGIKELVTSSDKRVYANISKSTYYKHIENYANLWAKRFNRRISSLKVYLGYKRLSGHTTKGIQRARLKMQLWRRKLRNINKNYIRQTVSDIVSTHPKYVTIENLNIKGMTANHKLAPAIQKLGFYNFKSWLNWQCKKHEIELREVDRYYPSTKLCSSCGHYNKEQFQGKISDLKIRTFKCSRCGLIMDRDLNASKNLEQVGKYSVI